MAADAKSYEILSRIIARVASALNMMYLKAFHAPAALATPAVSLKNFTAESTIVFEGQLQTWLLGSNSSHGDT
jgi:hypothetical protein